MPTSDMPPPARRWSDGLLPLTAMFQAQRVGSGLRHRTPWVIGATLHVVSAALPALVVLLSADGVRMAEERIARGARPDLDVNVALVGLASLSVGLRLAMIAALAAVSYAVFAALKKKQSLWALVAAAVAGTGAWVYASAARVVVTLAAPGATFASTVGHLVGASTETWAGRVLYGFDVFGIAALVVSARVLQGLTGTRGVAPWVAPVVVLGARLVAGALLAGRN